MSCRDQQVWVVGGNRTFLQHIFMKVRMVETSTCKQNT
jgi:hypothetical protein